MGLDDRKLEVLKAIVEDYVATEEPVSSRALVERHNLNVSPATVRNDMAVLEEEGYIRQPHTSAGRVPTNRGYRLFVDRLSRIKPLSQAERRAIERFLGGAVDLDDVVYRTVRLLAQLTRQVAVVQYPSLTRSSVRCARRRSTGPAARRRVPRAPAAPDRPRGGRGERAAGGGGAEGGGGAARAGAGGGAPRRGGGAGGGRRAAPGAGAGGRGA